MLLCPLQSQVCCIYILLFSINGYVTFSASIEDSQSVTTKTNTDNPAEEIASEHNEQADYQSESHSVGESEKYRAENPVEYTEVDSREHEKDDSSAESIDEKSYKALKNHRKSDDTLYDQLDIRSRDGVTPPIIDIDEIVNRVKDKLRSEFKYLIDKHTNAANKKQLSKADLYTNDGKIRNKEPINTNNTIQKTQTKYPINASIYTQNKSINNNSDPNPISSFKNKLDDSYLPVNADNATMKQLSINVITKNHPFIERKNVNPVDFVEERLNVRHPNDSYEDYELPKKDEDVFESEELKNSKDKVAFMKHYNNKHMNQEYKKDYSINPRYHNNDDTIRNDPKLRYKEQERQDYNNDEEVEYTKPYQREQSKKRYQYSQLQDSRNDDFKENPVSNYNQQYNAENNGKHTEITIQKFEKEEKLYNGKHDTRGDGRVNIRDENDRDSLIRNDKDSLMEGKRDSIQKDGRFQIRGNIRESTRGEDSDPIKNVGRNRLDIETNMYEIRNSGKSFVGKDEKYEEREELQSQEKNLYDGNKAREKMLYQKDTGRNWNDKRDLPIGYSAGKLREVVEARNKVKNQAIDYNENKYKFEYLDDKGENYNGRNDLDRGHNIEENNKEEDGNYGRQVKEKYEPYAGRNSDPWSVKPKLIRQKNEEIPYHDDDQYRNDYNNGYVKNKKNSEVNNEPYNEGTEKTRYDMKRYRDDNEKDEQVEPNYMTDWKRDPKEYVFTTTINTEQYERGHSASRYNDRNDQNSNYLPDKNTDRVIDYDQQEDTTNNIKGKTEKLWFDYKEIKVDNISRMVAVGEDNKPLEDKSHVMSGTGRPTKNWYRVPSPNYHGKLPIIAESYNFDEPLPEQDREKESLKSIWKNPPASINKKIKLK